MVESVCEEFDITVEDWDSISYGEDAEEDDDCLYVCEHCLMAIESREGNQVVQMYHIDETDPHASKCGWCKDRGFDRLYKLL
jgi:hypothetical protein